MSFYVLLTGKELVRKRVFLVTLLLSGLFFSLYGVGISKMLEATRHAETSLIETYAISLPVVTLGLFFAQMVLAFFVFFSSMGAISGEIDNGQMYAVLARPVPRWRIYLAKWIGFGVWNMIYGAVLFWSIILLNHFVLGFPLQLVPLLKAFLLFEWIPLLLGTVSLLGSSYLPMLGNGILCALLFGISMFAGFLEGVANPSMANEGLANFSMVTSLLMPADTVFRRMMYELIGGPNLPILTDMKDMMGPFSPAKLPNLAFLIYTVFYLIALLVWGSLRFTKRDIT